MQPSSKTAEAIKSAIEVAEGNGFEDVVSRLRAILRQLNNPRQGVAARG